MGACCSATGADAMRARHRASELARDVGALGEGQQLDMRAITSRFSRARRRRGGRCHPAKAADREN